MGQGRVTTQKKFPAPIMAVYQAPRDSRLNYHQIEENSVTLFRLLFVFQNVHIFSSIIYCVIFCVDTLDVYFVQK